MSVKVPLIDQFIKGRPLAELLNARLHLAVSKPLPSGTGRGFGFIRLRARAISPFVFSPMIKNVT